MHRENWQQTGNQILDLLAPPERETLLASAEVVSLDHGFEVYSPEGPIFHVYFPIRGVFSATVAMREGNHAEALPIGNEGMAGLDAYWGLDFSTARVVSQIPGEVLRLSVHSLHEAIAASPKLDELLRRYTSFALCAANQTVACNALHSSEQRICRWLLGAHDRAAADRFPLTHEFLAELLGVRRQTVTVVAGLLQKQNLIHYRRGAVEVVNRAGLEAAACECHATLQALYERIMQAPLVTPAPVEQSLSTNG